jgi:hypothetical protein
LTSTVEPDPFEFDEDDALGLEDDLAIASILGKRKRSEDDGTD